MLSPLLPPNATALEGALANAASLPHTPELLALLSDAQRCPQALLPWLAWALSVDEWDDDWPQEQQRAAVLEAADLHRKKGTPWAVLRALAVHGFPDSEIVEYATFLQEWQASGGKYLDGGWSLSGQALSPNVPGARDIVRNAALNHWAHYAIRVNSADMAWTVAQQQKMAAVARRYAPARSHLVAIIGLLRFGFSAAPHLAASKQHLRVRFDGCTRISATGHTHLDGCWLLDGDKHTPVLGGGWSLDGRQPLRNTYTGQPLDSGNLTLRPRVRLRLGFHAMAGERASGPRRLGWGHRRLDGRWKLGAHTLTGWRLDGRQGLIAAQFDQLAGMNNRIDGSWTLGSLGAEEATVWAHGRITVRRPGITTTESL